MPQLGGLDELDLGFGVQMAFPNTAIFEGHCDLDPNLERTSSLRPLLYPLPPVDLGSVVEGPPFVGTTLAVVAPTNFTSLNGVTDHFAPGGGNGQRVRYEVHRTAATTPPVPRMTLITQKHERIPVRPRRGRTVTRTDVELTVADWMARQVELPPLAHDKHDIRSEVRTFASNGVVTHANVWLWKGLAQVPDADKNWNIYL